MSRINPRTYLVTHLAFAFHVTLRALSIKMARALNAKSGSLQWYAHVAPPASHMLPSNFAQSCVNLRLLKLRVFLMNSSSYCMTVSALLPEFARGLETRNCWSPRTVFALSRLARVRVTFEAAGTPFTWPISVGVIFQARDSAQVGAWHEGAGARLQRGTSPQQMLDFSYRPTQRGERTRMFKTFGPVATHYGIQQPGVERVRWSSRICTRCHGRPQATKCTETAQHDGQRARQLFGVSAVWAPSS